MKLSLYFRQNGMHHLKNECEIIGQRNDYIEHGKINEQKIIDNLPKDFLKKPERCLLSLANKDYSGSVAQIGLSVFKNWAKYFDAYVLEIGF
jgi:hypothetical protein